MKKIFLFIFLFFVMVFLVQAGSLTGNCTIENVGAGGSCPNADEIVAFYVSNGGGNAHAHLPSTTVYGYAVCCPQVDLDQVCGTNHADIVFFTDMANGHVEGPAGPPSGTSACLHDSIDEKVVNCDTTFDSEPGEYCVASIPQLTNAHVGPCGYYANDIYCNVVGGGLPDCVLDGGFNCCLSAECISSQLGYTGCGFGEECCSSCSSCLLTAALWCPSPNVGTCFFGGGAIVDELDEIFLLATGPDCGGFEVLFPVFESDGGFPEEFIELAGSNLSEINVAYINWTVVYAPGDDISGDQLQYQFNASGPLIANNFWSDILVVNPICDPLSTCWDNSDCPLDPCYTNIWCDKSTPKVDPFCECAMSGYTCGPPGPYGADIIIRIRGATDCIDDGDGDNIGTYNITLQYFNTSATPPDFIGDPWTESSKQCFLDQDIPFYGLFSLILTIFFIGAYYKRKSFKKN